MEEQNQKMIIGIDGKDYDYNALPEEVKNLIQLYNKWNIEYQNSKTETVKLEMALAGLSKQIVAETSKMSGETPKIEIRENNQ